MGVVASLVALMVFDPKDDQVVAVLGGVFFGVSGLVVLFHFGRPSTLTLDTEGFRLNAPWRSWQVRWDDVVNFHVNQGGSRSLARTVAFDYVGEPASSWPHDRPHQLPAFWSLSPLELRDLMARCKDTWGSRKTNSRTDSLG